MVFWEEWNCQNHFWTENHHWMTRPENLRVTLNVDFDLLTFGRLLDSLKSVFRWFEEYFFNGLKGRFGQIEHFWLVWGKFADDSRNTCSWSGEVLAAMQGHPSHFPAQWGPASYPTLPRGKGGRQSKEGVLPELVLGRWTGVCMVVIWAIGGTGGTWGMIQQSSRAFRMGLGVW